MPRGITIDDLFRLRLVSDAQVWPDGTKVAFTFRLTPGRFLTRIRKTVKETSPATRIAFNPPYWKPADPLWVDHPMVNDSAGLLAEYSKPETPQYRWPTEPQ